jgi:hypothetical protein
VCLTSRSEARSGTATPPSPTIALALGDALGVPIEYLCVGPGGLAAYTEGLKGGLDIAALKAATEQLNEELASLRRRRSQIEAWQVDAEAESARIRKLWELAEVAHRRMAGMSLEEKKAILDLLDVRVVVTGYRPLQIRIEGVVHDGLLDRFEGSATTVVGRQGLEPCPPD